MLICLNSSVSPSKLVIKRVLILEAAVARITTEHLGGQEVLFQDVSELLEDQLQLAKKITEPFNYLASPVGVAEIDLDSIRTCDESSPSRSFRQDYPENPAALECSGHTTLLHQNGRLRSGRSNAAI
jgi:hypothetical protein